MYRSLGDTSANEVNPLDLAVAQAKGNASTALWWGLGMLFAVGFLIYRPGRK